MKIEDAIGALAALAQNTRLETFRLLVKHEPVGVAAGELARLLVVPQNTLSAHLAILSRAGLVRSDRRSRSIVYRAHLETFRDLTLFMVQDCCGGSRELCEPLIERLLPCCTPKTAGPSKAARGKRAKEAA
jgi:DNA-binding transcriptional ArsR family regulator